MGAFENYLTSLQRFGIQPGLERIEALLQRFDLPHLKYPHLLIGGTNGKGSTCEFLARLLAQEGKRVGLYTSPHLYRWNERIRIKSSQITDNAQFSDAISDDDLDALFFAAKSHLDAVAQVLGQPTEFETITALAFWHFARTNVDAAVLEVGLGGRWDATNTSAPLVSVITHVALDHCDRLGNSLEAIARDKVEITRAGRILVSAETKPEILEIFATHCAQKKARFWPIFAPDWSNDRKHLDECLRFVHAAPNAPDNFQQINWQTALAAHFAFAHERAISPQLPAAVFNFQVPGRLEVVREKPRVVFDVCNNPDGAAFLAAAFQERFPDAQGHTILVLGILGDKDYAAMTHLLAPLARVVIATQSQSPRAAPADSIAASARPFCSHVETISSVTKAVKRAFELAADAETETVLVAGSFTNMEEAISAL